MMFLKNNHVLVANFEMTFEFCAELAFETIDLLLWNILGRSTHSVLL